MNAPLVDAIKTVLKLVGDGDRAEISRADMQRYKDLAEDVYVLAFQAGLDRAIPQQADLDRLMNFPDMPHAWFEGKLNLPGDWLPYPGGFMPVPQGQWLDDMLVLLRLADEGSAAEFREQRKTRTPDVSVAADERICKIIANQSLSADEMCRQISREDSRYYFSSSSKLEKLIGKSGVRQTDWWRVDRVDFRQKERDEREPPSIDEL